jgi:hypothetical protein
MVILISETELREPEYNVITLPSISSQGINIVQLIIWKATFIVRPTKCQVRDEASNLGSRL